MQKSSLSHSSLWTTVTMLVYASGFLFPQYMCVGEEEGDKILEKGSYRKYFF